MWIVAVGWIYVVILMAATETSVIAGIMTFFGYCVLPLSILFYITGAKRRRKRRFDASTSSSASYDTPDEIVPLSTPALFVPGGIALHDGMSDDCGSDSGGCDGGGGDGGGGGGD